MTSPTPPNVRPRIGLAFSGLMLGMVLGALDQTIVATALPTIVSDLGGLNQLSSVVTARLRVPAAALDPVLQCLIQAGIETGAADRPLALIPAGEQAATRLTAARRQGLADLLAGWSPEQHPKLAQMLSRLSRTLLAQGPGDQLLPARRAAS